MRTISLLCWVHVIMIHYSLASTVPGTTGGASTVSNAESSLQATTQSSRGTCQFGFRRDASGFCRLRLAVMMRYNDSLSSASAQQDLVAILLAVSHYNERNNVIISPLSVGPKIVVDLYKSAGVLADESAVWNQMILDGAAAILGPTQAANIALTQSITKSVPIAEIGWKTTASFLENNELYPFFCRNVPSDAPIAQLTAKFLANLGVKRVGFLYEDQTGSSFLNLFSQSCATERVQIVLALNGTIELEIRAAVRRLHVQKIHYVVLNLAGPPSSSAEIALDEAMKIGMIGPDFVWIMTSDADPRNLFATRADRLSILNGCFWVAPTPPAGAKWETFQSLMQSATTNTLTAPHGISVTIPPASLQNIQPSSAYAYDAAMIALNAIAISSTSTTEPPNGRTIFSSMTKSSLVGVTGLNRMNSVGSRDVATYTVSISNFYTSQSSTVLRTKIVARLDNSIFYLDSSSIFFAGGSTPPSYGPVCTRESFFSEENIRCEFRIGLMNDLTVGSDPTPVRLSAQRLAGLLLAVDHINNRNYSHVTTPRPLHPDLYLQPAVFNTLSAPAGAMSALKKLWSTNDEIATKTYIDVITPAILGPELDSTSQPLQLLANIQDTVTMTYVSDISVNGDDSLYVSAVPYLKHTAAAMAHVVHRFGWKRVGILLARGQNNIEFQLNFASAYTTLDIAAVLQFDAASNSSVADACSRLRTANIRVIVAVISPLVKFHELMTTADKFGIVGPGFSWIVQLDEDLHTLLARSPDPVSTASLLHGVVRLRFAPTAASGEKWIKLKAEIAGINLDLVNNYAPVTISRSHLDSNLSPTVATAYDSVWLLAASMSQLMFDGGNFYGSNIMQKLKDLIFSGVTGEVDIDADEHNARAAATMNILVENWFLNVSSGTNSTNFHLSTAAPSNLLEKVIFVWNATHGLSLVEGVNVTFSNSGPTPPLDGSGCGGGSRFDPTDMVCVACAAGSSSSEQNRVSDSCNLCVAGTFAPTPGLSRCIPCSTVGGFTNATGATACESCPPSTQKQTGSPGLYESECLCVPGTFSPTGVRGDTCLDCPLGGVCSGELLPPTPDSGYWSEADFPSEFFICGTTYNCLGNFNCHAGFEDRLCEACSEGYFAVGKKCFECPAGDAAKFSGTIFFIIAVIILFIVVNELANLAEPLDILLLFMQIQQLIQTFDLNWPAEADTLNTIFYLFNFNIDIISPACIAAWSYSASFWFQFLLPIFDLALCAMTFVGAKIILTLTLALKINFRVGPKDEPQLQRIKDRLIKHWFAFLVSNYNALAQSALESFYCRKLPSGAWMLLASPPFDCGTGLHTLHIVGSIMAIIFYVVGVPAAIGYVLFQNGRKHGLLNNHQFLRRYGWLYQRYKPKYFFWALVVTARRFAMCAIITLIRFDKYVQALLGILILLSCLAADFITAPFVDWKLNLLDCAGLSVCVIYVFCGLLFDAGFSHQTELFWALVVLLIIVILFGIAITFHDFYEKKAHHTALKLMADKCGRSLEVARKDFARRNLVVTIERDDCCTVSTCSEPISPLPNPDDFSGEITPQTRSRALNAPDALGRRSRGPSPHDPTPTPSRSRGATPHDSSPTPSRRSQGPSPHDRSPTPSRKSQCSSPNDPSPKPGRRKDSPSTERSHAREDSAKGVSSLPDRRFVSRGDSNVSMKFEPQPVSRSNSNVSTRFEADRKPVSRSSSSLSLPDRRFVSRGDSNLSLDRKTVSRSNSSASVKIEPARKATQSAKKKDDAAPPVQSAAMFGSEKVLTQVEKEWKEELMSTLARLGPIQDQHGNPLPKLEAKFGEITEKYLLDAAVGKISWDRAIALTLKHSEIINTFEPEKIFHWAEREPDPRMFSLLYSADSFLRTFVSDESETAHSNHSDLSDFLWKLCSSFPFIIDWALQASPAEHHHFSKWVEDMVRTREVVGKRGLYSSYIVGIDKGSMLMWMARDADKPELDIVKALLTRMVSTSCSEKVKSRQNNFPLAIDPFAHRCTSAMELVNNLVLRGCNKSIRTLVRHAPSRKEVEEDAIEMEEMVREILSDHSDDGHDHDHDHPPQEVVEEKKQPQEPMRKAFGSPKLVAIDSPKNQIFSAHDDTENDRSDMSDFSPPIRAARFSKFDNNKYPAKSVLKKTPSFQYNTDEEFRRVSAMERPPSRNLSIGGDDLFSFSVDSPFVSPTPAVPEMQPLNLPPPLDLSKDLPTPRAPSGRQQWAALTRSLSDMSGKIWGSPPAASDSTESNNPRSPNPKEAVDRDIEMESKRGDRTCFSGGFFAV